MRNTESADFHASRCAYSGRLLPVNHAGGITATDPDDRRRQALRALEHGKMARLEERAASLARHGGRHDLVSMARDDERNLFRVTCGGRRERPVARWPCSRSEEAS